VAERSTTERIFDADRMVTSSGNAQQRMIFVKWLGP